MSGIKRLVSSIRANFEWMVNQVENHEALVGSVIQEAQQAQARAKVQLASVRKDGSKMRERLVSLENDERSWSERAIKSAAIDESRAIECLRRKKKASEERTALSKQIEEHAILEKQLNQDLTLIDARIDELKRKRNTLRTRESRADALRAVHSDEAGIVTDLESILERWEVKITQTEIGTESLTKHGDPLQREFVDEEEQADLRVELAELVQSQNINA